MSNVYTHLRENDGNVNRLSLVPDTALKAAIVAGTVNKVTCPIKLNSDATVSLCDADDIVEGYLYDWDGHNPSLVSVRMVRIKNNAQLAHVPCHGFIKRCVYTGDAPTVGGGVLAGGTNYVKAGAAKTGAGTEGDPYVAGTGDGFVLGVNTTDTIAYVLS